MVIQVRNLTKLYGKKTGCRDISFEVKKGEVVALLGRNGVGKTTTLNSIMGFVKPRRGRIIFKETDITPLETFEISRMGIGYVPQGRHLFPKMSVLENLKTGMIRTSDKDGLDRVFELFPNLKGRLGQKAGSLSGGEQQALAISRAILMEPEILMLDEPTTGLMPLFVGSLQEIIKKLNEQGMTILLIEEKVPFALALAHRVYFMVKGKVEHTATKEELQGQKDIFVRYLGVEV